MQFDILGHLVYLIYPVMLVVLLWGAKFYGFKKQWNEEVIDLSQTKYIEGFIAICIMLHHIGQEMCGSWQYYPLIPGLEFFVPLGFMFVSVFMFFSGYGLYISVEKRPDYLSKGFMKRKALPLIIGFYVSGLVFFAARYLLGQPMSKKDIILYITGYGMPNSYSWFALVMPLFYLIFLIVFRVFRKFRIPVMIVCISIFTFIGMCLNHSNNIMGGEWWYNSVHLFWIGLIVGKYRDKFFAGAKKLYWVKLVLCIVALIAAWKLRGYTDSHFGYWNEGAGVPLSYTLKTRAYCLGAEMLTSTLFVLSILLINMKLKFGNKVLGFFGKITFEFYIVHGFVVELFSYRFCDATDSIVRITNGALMIVVVAALSIPLALLMKKVCFIFNKKK